MTNETASAERGERQEPEIALPAITTTADITEWLDAVATGRWTWTRNTRCKYVDLKLDTRRGAYCILDRNGEQITFEQLRWQYPAPLPTLKDTKA